MFVPAAHPSSHLSRSFHGSDALLCFVDSCVKEGCKILSLVAQL